MKGDGCRRVIERLLPDIEVVEVSGKGKPLGYVSRKYKRRVGLSDGLRKALRGMLADMGDSAPPVRVYKWP